MTRDDLTSLQKTVADTFVSDPVVQYIVDLIVATRSKEDILRGASPRATLAVTSLSKAVARLRGRDYVVPGDVREVFSHAIAHRIVVSPRAESQRKCPDQILREILEATPIPKLR
jgi:MoxR-like ATPase